MADPRPDERRCTTCELWKHHSRFASRERRNLDGSTTIHFDPECRDCQQIARNERKNVDRPRSIIEDRAAAAATKAGVAKAFFWENMLYRTLVAPFRAMMTDEGACTDCGHEFRDQSDIQIDHCEPPRHRQDWARLHARNVMLKCKSCNNIKGALSFAEHLDAAELRRLSNEANPSPMPPPPPAPIAWRASPAKPIRLAVTPAPAAPGTDACGATKRKLHGNPERLSTWRCVLPPGHDGPHRTAPQANQAPWYDDPTLDLD